MQERQLLGRPPSQPIFKLQMWEVEPCQLTQMERSLARSAYPEAVQEAYPGFGAASGAPPSERTFRSPRGTRFRVREGFCKILPCGAKSSLGFMRAFTGKQYRRCGVLRKRAWDV